MKTNIIIFISLFVMFYLAGCFIEVTFNIAEWREDVRLGVAIFGIPIAAIITLGYNEVKETNDYYDNRL